MILIPHQLDRGGCHFLLIDHKQTRDRLVDSDLGGVFPDRLDFAVDFRGTLDRDGDVTLGRLSGEKGHRDK